MVEHVMPRDAHVDALIQKLVRAIAVSLAAAAAAQDAVEEIVQRGADTSVFFADAGARSTPSARLTAQDRDFLRAVSIEPDR